MESNQIPGGGNNAVTSATFAAKFRSKRGKQLSIPDFSFTEIFTFLSLDVQAYLPAFHTVTVYFCKSSIKLMIIVKDLIQGKRKFVPMDRVVHIHVPGYENLKLEEIFSFFLQHEAVIPFMPDEKELRKTPKQWVCNVGATVIGAPFVAWVKQRVMQRNAAVATEKNLLISMDSAVAAAFHASTSISRKH